MTYRSKLDGQRERRLSVLSSEEELIGRVLIGEDEEESVLYSAFVSLAIVPGQPSEHRELRFAVVEASPEGEQFCLNGLETRRYLRGVERATVLGCIAEMACRLVGELRPSYITMVTADTDLPQKALAKYATLCQSIETLGYQWGRGNRYLGTEIWMMTLK